MSKKILNNKKKMDAVLDEGKLSEAWL